MSGVSQISQLIIKHHLEPLASPVRSAMKEAIRLVTSPERAVLAVGESRFGGRPDLPEHFTWPAWQDIPMSFIAQIRLADLSGFAPARTLPDSGLLSFFYDARQETYGASPQDKGGWRVAFFPHQTALKTANFPPSLPQNARFTPCPLQFQSIWTLPASLTQASLDLNMTGEQVKQYEALLSDFNHAQGTGAPHHQMFGWPDQLQDDMQLQSVMLSHGITEITDPREKEAEQNKKDWLLLLQVDSDDTTGMRWGSSGMIDYWGREQDLQAKEFDHTWLVLQSD